MAKCWYRMLFELEDSSAVLFLDNVLKRSKKYFFFFGGKHINKEHVTTIEYRV